MALGAAVVLVLTGVLSTDGLFATLGDDTVWLPVPGRARHAAEG